MEGSDVFTQGTEIGDGDDPFAGSDFADFEETKVDDFDGEAPPEALADRSEGLPVVDREGQPVPAVAGTLPAVQRAEPENELGTPEGTPSPLREPAPEQRAGPVAETAAPVAEAPPAPAAAEPAAEAAAPPAAPEVAQEAPPAAEEPPVAEPEPSAAAENVAEIVGEMTTLPEAAPSVEASAVDAPADAPEVDPDAPIAAETQDAPEPDEPVKDSKGRTTHRKYVILQVMGPGKFNQVSWHVNDKGKMVAKSEPGSKRQTVAVARGTDEALKIAFAAVGAPANGTNLIAVAAAYFQMKHVAPLPPEPERQRLKIA